TMEDLPELPGDTLLHHAATDPKAIPDLQGALGIADRAAALADGILLIQQDAGDALAGQIERRCKPNRAAAHDSCPAALDAAGRYGLTAKCRVWNRHPALRSRSIRPDWFHMQLLTDWPSAGQRKQGMVNTF